VISDYTDIILRNIAQNIRLNRKGNLVKGTEGCLEEDDRVAVKHPSFSVCSVVPPSHFIYFIPLLGLSSRLEYFEFW
jgi:hypothetical protein